MTDALNGKPPTSFWIVGAVALTWNLIGLMIFYNQVTLAPEALEKFTELQQSFLTTTPLWATVAYGIAVVAGVLGSVLLLLRMAWAVPAFLLSLAGIVVQDLHAFVLSNGLEAFGPAGLVVPSVVLIIGIALVWYSRSAKAKGWLT